MLRKSAEAWFARCSERHQHRANDLIQWLCVPAIFFCLLGFAWEIPLPASWEGSVPWFNGSLVAIVLLAAFYARLSWRLTVGLLAFMAVCHTVLLQLDFFSPRPIWKICLVLFAGAVIVQFIGRRLEGKKTSFLEVIGFVFIGPAWLLSRIYRKSGQKY